ncbi:MULTISPECIES: acyl-CoA synthetase family protein [Halolamina]|uniref:AMP-binding enzyme n=1 Tax=Halolamina pelagica TaxID=699431 RepID=A0A1I5MZ01_9EURY|nr:MULTISPECIES: AMP-binding protein [Halolamina]NHX36212.1 AMP-binding protein [Halolamina sp. R1-12]SFP14326.1 AMP-binding enzyme [Halolamina pelagica]
MDAVGDLLARDRRSDRPALVVGDGRERSYHELITNAYKAGNVLRFHGVGEGRTVAVAPVPDLPPVFAFLGAAQLGAATRFDPEAGADAGDRLLLVPGAEQAAYDPGPGTKLAVFGDDADAADTVDWEESVWSENPAFPPTSVDPATPLLVGEDWRVSHGDALTAAAEVADLRRLDADSRVVVRSSLAEPGAVVAGLLAPLLVGGCAVLADPAAPASDARGDLAVTSGRGPEPATLAPDDVLRSVE